MAGSVDDGKSTLTGRLLYECKAIPSDQLYALEKKSANGILDFSLLADGLEAEREQGITIDVAHRYFSTRRRKFIIADAPGHEEYTRNMVTAAAGSDAAIILIDITKLDLSTNPIALLPQTHRHVLLIRLLDVPSIVFAVNKIDAVPDPARAFAVMRDAILRFAKAAHVRIAGIVPISALRGDNVAAEGYEWFDGPSLLDLLEELPAGVQSSAGGLLMPVQYVSRDPSQNGNGHVHANSARVFWGRVARGRVQAGESIQVFPSNQRATVTAVQCAGEDVTSVGHGGSAGVVLDRHVDAARGCWLSSPDSVESSDRFTATLAWMDNELAQVGRKYLVRHGTRWIQGRIAAIESCLDVHTLEPKNAHALALNDIAEVVVETAEPLPLEPYRSNHVAGSMILVDASTHRTSGVLMVKKARWDAPADGRANIRVPVDFSVRYRTGGVWGTARAHDLGMGGLLMSTDSVIATGSRIEIWLHAPGGLVAEDAAEVHAHARVIAHRTVEGKECFYHLAFYDIDFPTYEALSRLVRLAVD